MSSKRWIISDIAKKTGIEAHVLRYWEKELDLEIPRNEMGHRYYLDRHIELFQKIHELKEAGYQLKAIKNVISSKGIDFECSDYDEDRNNVIEMPIQALRQAVYSETAASSLEHADSNMISGIFPPVTVQATAEQQPKVQFSKEDKLEQFKQMLGEVMLETISKRDDEIGIKISDRIIKQMDYLMRMQEELEDERFKRLDETIRNTQKERQECRITGKNGKKSLFGKNKKIVTQ